ncbi:aromatic ring-hydroxylating oxygenase subunit alpha [Bradyrhizobium sp.]|uniref:aromatic ring-hydroxylating oxygenase subunit alpha n=1 Tax=Bradyrhizobium sp. TaxID=376 RepID=UPI003C74A24B
MDRYLRDSFWHLVAHKSELPKSRDYTRLRWLDDDLVIFRDGADVIAFDNRCPHRGSRFFVNDAGNRPAVCPYHGWSYSAGKMHVTDPSVLTRCSPGDIRLNKYQVEWCGDFLFVGISPKESLRDQLGAAAGLLERISRRIVERVDVNQYVYECDWRVAIENALEPYHVPLIHPSSLGLLKLDKGRNEFIGINSVWYAEVGNARMAKQLAGVSRLFSMDYQYNGYISIFLFPFSMLSSTYGFSYSLQHFFPSATPSATWFSSRLLAVSRQEGVPWESVESFFASTAKINRQVFEEDREICRNVHANAWSSSPPLFYADLEEKVLHFRESYRQAEARMDRVPNA